MRLFESDLSTPRDETTDLKALADYKGIILSLTDSLLRILTWEDLYKNLGHGYLVREYLRSEDPPHDDDLFLEGLRFNTRSGVFERDFFPVNTSENQYEKIKFIYGNYLDPNLPLI